MVIKDNFDLLNYFALNLLKPLALRDDGLINEKELIDMIYQELYPEVKKSFLYPEFFGDKAQLNKNHLLYTKIDFLYAEVSYRKNNKNYYKMIQKIIKKLSQTNQMFLGLNQINHLNQRYLDRLQKINKQFINLSDNTTVKEMLSNKKSFQNKIIIL